MEKITYQSLIAHLKDQHSLYNQAYLDHEMKFGMADKHALHKWIVEVIQPALAGITKSEPDSVPAVFKAFYNELLQLTGSGLIFTNEKEYRALWQVCTKMPKLMRTHPAKVLASLRQALQSVRTFQPAMTMKWIELMDKTVQACASYNELLHCGRMNAWFCGLAQLRDKCREQFANLSAPLKEELQKNCPLQLPMEKLMSGSWINKSNAVFIDAPGGFTGLGGAFTAPPTLTEVEDYIVASDNENSFALFADEFGRVLVPGPKQVTGSNTGVSIFKLIQKSIPAFDDVSSCILKNNTVYFTRESSHHIYIYGWSNEN